LLLDFLLISTQSKHHSNTCPKCAVLSGLFRARLLKVLLEEGVIRQQIADLLLTWNHHSGFNEELLPHLSRI
jgi:hypothetical protein